MVAFMEKLCGICMPILMAAGLAIFQFGILGYRACLIELDDGKIYRKSLYLMVKTMVFL